MNFIKINERLKDDEDYFLFNCDKVFYILKSRRVLKSIGGNEYHASCKIYFSENDYLSTIIPVPYLEAAILAAKCGNPYKKETESWSIEILQN